MISFYNDYNEIGHPALLEEMTRLKDKKFIGYSEDEEVKNAIKLIKKELNDENVSIHFVNTGTIANVLGILFSLERYESVISANTGHIINTENGAIEATGHQVIQVKEENGKITGERLKKAIYNNRNEFSSKPGVVYISNATELGTVYNKKELEELHNICRENDMYLFMDGARIAAAIASSKSDLEFKDITKYVDIFTIGGNKNGFIFGEALVIVNDNLKSKYERKIIKQRGSLLAKGFLLGIQFRTMFESGLFFENAKNAVEMSERLGKAFEKCGIKPCFNIESNIIFVDLPIVIHEKLSKDFMYSSEKLSDEKVHCRFLTSWATRIEDIEKFEKSLSSIVKELN